jgi:hypothetical protein
MYYNINYHNPKINGATVAPCHKSLIDHHVFTSVAGYTEGKE